MNARFIWRFGTALLLTLIPCAAHAQAPAARPPSYHFSVRAVDTAPPPRIPPPIEPTPSTNAGATVAAITPPRFDLLWSDVLDRALADFRSLTEVSADALSAIFQPGPLDTMVSARPDPFIPSGTPDPVPLGVQVGLVRVQPVAVISPLPMGAEIRGAPALLPTAVLELPWMIP